MNDNLRDTIGTATIHLIESIGVVLASRILLNDQSLPFTGSETQDEAREKFESVVSDLFIHFMKITGFDSLSVAKREATKEIFTQIVYEKVLEVGETELDFRDE